MIQAKHDLLAALREAVAELAPEAGLVPAFESPKQASHGDLAITAAMQLAPLKKNPRELARAWCRTAAPPAVQRWVDGARHRRPRLHQPARDGRAPSRRWCATVLAEGDALRRASRTTTDAIIEFVSANPTGPLHVGHGRQAALGDASAACSSRRAHGVTREFYYNDAGVQIATLANSVQARAPGLQAGRRRMARVGLQRRLHRRHRGRLPGRKTVLGRRPRVHRPRRRRRPRSIRHFAVAYLRHEQDLDLQAFGVKFDNYYLESSLYTSGQVEEAVRARRRRQHLRAGRRAVAAHHRLRRRQGPRDAQVRRHLHLFRAGRRLPHQQVGARLRPRRSTSRARDHHGTIARVRAGLQAVNIGIPQGYPDYVLHKMVTVMKDGEEVKISKRAGCYVTVRDLIEVGTQPRRGALLPHHAQGRHRVRVRRRRRAKRNDENPVYLRAVRARAHLLGAGQLGRRRSRRWPTPTCRCSTTPPRLACCSSWPTTRRCSQRAAAELAPHQVAFYLRDTRRRSTATTRRARAGRRRPLKRARLALAVGHPPGAAQRPGRARRERARDP